MRSGSTPTVGCSSSTTARGGPPALTTELSRPLWRLLGAGFVPGRDLPGALRRCGFSVLSLERFGLPTLTLPLRSCVAGMARRQRPNGMLRPKAAVLAARRTMGANPS